MQACSYNRSITKSQYIKNFLNLNKVGTTELTLLSSDKDVASYA